jgi:hypothetical protein
MAAYFPQLLTGTSSQFPLRRALRFRTVSEGGRGVPMMRVADGSVRRVEWAMQLQGLCDAEAEALTTLFRDSRGTQRAFVFCDPEDNLLLHSEGLSQAEWQKSGGVSVSAAPTAAPGMGAAWRVSTASGSGEMWQQVMLPTQYQWVFSVYARAEAGGELLLVQRSAHGERTHAVKPGSEWQRYWLMASGWPPGEGMDFGIRVQAGGPVDVSGFQLEGQLSPSGYKKTTSTCGVYADARFADERLRVMTIAKNCHQVALRVTAPLPRYDR